MLKEIKIIAFNAADTLWINEEYESAILYLKELKRRFTNNLG